MEIKKIYKYKSLIGLVILAFLLRVIGIKHGSPYIFNLDEPTVVKTAFSLIHGQNLERFDWPHFNFYFNYLIFEIFIKIRAVLNLIPVLKTWLLGLGSILWTDPFVFYVISRLTAVIFGALTIIPLYLLTEKLSNKTTAIISGLIFALIPYHVWFSHLTMQDVPMLFWLTSFIYFAYLFSESSDYKYVVLSSIFLGIAASYKYNAIVFGLIFVCFLLIRKYKANIINSIVKPISILIFSTVFIFLTINHNIIIKWDKFWSYEPGIGYLWQLKDNSQPLSLSEYPSGLAKHLFSISEDIGLLISVLVVVGVVLVMLRVIKEKRMDAWLILVIFAISFVLFMSRYGRAGPRYFIPVYGIIAMVSAYAVSNLMVGLNRFYKYLALAIFLIPIIASTLIVDIKFINKDTRTMVLEKYYNDEISLYFKGESMDAVNSLNNLKIPKFDLDRVHSGDIVVSENEIASNKDTVKISLLEIIDNNFRNGPKFYVYKID